MHRFAILLSLLLLVPAQCFAQDIVWRDDFQTVSEWNAMPTWLGNPSTSAQLTTDGEIAEFVVREPRKGMKWCRAVPQLFLGEMPYLCVRYRAFNFNTDRTDYFIYLDDHTKGMCEPIKLNEVIPDGKWHLVAVDARRFAKSDTIGAIAVQVQANEDGNARLQLDFIGFSETVPKGARELHPAPVVSLPDLILPLGESAADWQHHSDWLSNPADHFDATHDGKVATFSVRENGRGMKWSYFFGKEISIRGMRYVRLRYRARNIAPSRDYLLCVLGNRKDGKSYAAAVRLCDITPDGRWHSAILDIGKLAEDYPTIHGIAVQVQAGSDPQHALLSIAEVRFSTEPPTVPFSDFVEWKSGADFRGFQPVSLPADSDLSRLLRFMRIVEYPSKGEITAFGIPFRLVRAEPRCIASGIGEKTDLSLPARARTNEIYILMLARLVGMEEPSRSPSRKGRLFRRIADVDRFRLRMIYADGTADECLPVNIATGKFEITNGAQVLCAFPDESRTLEKLVVVDRCKRAAFAILAVTASAAKERRFAEFLEETSPLKPSKPLPAPTATPPRVEQRSDLLTLSNAHLELTLKISPAPVIERLYNRAARDSCIKVRTSQPFCEVQINGNPADYRLIGKPRIIRKENSCGAELTYALADKAELRIALSLDSSNEIRLDAAFKNVTDRPILFSFKAPVLRGILLGDSLDNNYYLFPRKCAAFSNALWSYRSRYSGGFPVQFVSAFNPFSNSGLYIRTEDRRGVCRYYRLVRDSSALNLCIEYPERELEPRGTRNAVKTIIGVCGGDWREGFEAYRSWLKSWYPPPDPSKEWFRRVFNFRQRFLRSHDPLYDGVRGEFHLERAIEEAEREFGGIDYLHLFDWGNCPGYGRLYGRTGDISPYQFFKGGRDAFRKAIAGVQAKGVPVGLYIEGYLLQEKGRLGQKYGKQWQLIGKSGEGRYWPNSSEMYICPFVPEWREVQATTYATKVKELDVDGMYIDEYGFADESRDCYSPRHGHPVPGYAVIGEMGCTKMIRESIDRVKKGVALYSEESPCDVASRYQDGSFTYAMRGTLFTNTLVPINIFRFALPQFKTIEILVCDRPTGTWATGVKWTFFNGEAIWLEGVAKDWFSEETRAAIRKCYAILRAHADAFTTLQPEPLIQTEIGGVFANKFPAEYETVYTLYNSRHRTVRGFALRLPHRDGAEYFDARNERGITPKRDGDFDLIPVEIEPRGVGCIVRKFGKEN